MRGSSGVRPRSCASPSAPSRQSSSWQSSRTCPESPCSASRRAECLDPCRRACRPPGRRRPYRLVRAKSNCLSRGTCRRPDGRCRGRRARRNVQHTQATDHAGQILPHVRERPAVRRLRRLAAKVQTRGRRQRRQRDRAVYDWQRTVHARVQDTAIAGRWTLNVPLVGSAKRMRHGHGFGQP